jgi:hypothetical protein
MPENGTGGDTSKYINYSNINHGKGHTYEERYGVEKALKLKQLRSKNFLKPEKAKHTRKYTESKWPNIYVKKDPKIVLSITLNVLMLTQQKKK